MALKSKKPQKRRRVMKIGTWTKEFLSKSPRQTQKIAANLVQKILKPKPRGRAIVFALEGELGAGKTTFVKGFAKALGVKSYITSPTFVLLKKYKILDTKYKILVHIDVYRLKNYRDLIPLGIKEIMANPQNIVLIEWADRVKKILPRHHTKIHFDHVDAKTRKIKIVSSI